MPARTRLDFAIGEEGLKSVKHLAPVDVFLAAGITDGEGKKTNRLIFRAKGDRQFYFLFNRVAGGKTLEAQMKKPAPWLQKRLEGLLPSEDAPIPEDTVADVPVGSPMEA